MLKSVDNVYHISIVQVHFRLQSNASLEKGDRRKGKG